MSTMTRLAEARPEIAGRPHTVVSPAERAALFRSITGEAPAVSSYVGEGETVDLTARRTRSRRPVLLAAAVVVVAAAVGAGLVLRDGGSDQTPATPPPTTEPEAEAAPLPAGFDPSTASAVFRADGRPDAVAAAYLEDIGPPGTLAVAPAAVDGHQATVHWDHGRTEGDLLLRRDGEGWAVVASTIDGIDLSSLRATGHRVTGEVRRVGEDGALFVDLLGPTGLPIVETIQDDEDPLRDLIPVDVRTDGSVIVRVQVLGGTVLGVAEVALDPPPVVSEGAGDSTVRVQERLGETCVGLASGAGRVCTSPDDQLWPDGVWYLQLGPAGRHDFQVLVTGYVHPSVESIQVRRADGTELDAATSRLALDDGAYVVAAVPVVDGPVSVDLLGSTGVLDTVQLDGLLPVGG
jgi:hypothetical protein